MPIKLEICSGAGEWVVEQAKADQGRASWVALELRHDRVHQIFTRMILGGTKNLAVLGGDAYAVLPSNIRPGSVSEMFVNHPEPPQQTGGDASEAQHLLNAGFFKSMAAALKPGGMITIVTDNLWCRPS